MISKINKDQNKPAFTYSYSSQNQLIRIQMTSSALGPVVRDISYNYDALGRRMEKRVVDTTNPQNSKVRRFVYDGDNIIAEYDTSSLLASYIHSPLRADDVLSVSVTSDGAAAGIASASGNFYFLKDHLGSISDIVTGSGNRVQKYEYSAFGKILAIRDASGNDVTSSPALRTSYTFTGREWDDESGLYYYRARYYDPTLGRFLQVDPDPGKANSPSSFTSKYSYVENAPIDYTDPTGTIKRPGDITNVHGNYCGESARGDRRLSSGRVRVDPPEDTLDRSCQEHDEAYGSEYLAFSSDLNPSIGRVKSDINLIANGIAYVAIKPVDGLSVAFGGTLFLAYSSVRLVLIDIPLGAISGILNGIGISIRL